MPHFCNYVKKKLLDDNKARDPILNKWVNLLIEESSRTLRKFPWIKKAKIESMYIGEGTAAVFQVTHLQKLMNHVCQNYCVEKEAEISLEGNPDNFINSLLDEAFDIGFNRFSLGVQSLQNDVMNFL